MWFMAEVEDTRLWKILSTLRAKVRGSEVMSCTRWALTSAGRGFRKAARRKKWKAACLRSGAGLRLPQCRHSRWEQISGVTCPWDDDRGCWGRVPDEVESLDSNLLRQRLDTVIKLGLTDRHSLELELRLSLNKPRLDVVWPERRQLHSNCDEKVCSGESGGNSLEDGCGSPGIETAEKKHVKLNSPSLPMWACAEKQGGRHKFWQGMKKMYIFKLKNRWILKTKKKYCCHLFSNS